jgi:hypothetical protein
MVLRASGASAANFQQLLHSDLGAVGVNTHSQIDAHIADSTQNNDSGTSTIELFSASKMIAGVNGAIAGTLIFKGGYDAATNTPDLDVAPAGAIQQGWTYTVAGTFLQKM